ncbi:MAG: acyltransferase family protein [Bacteroidota bacterium]
MAGTDGTARAEHLDLMKGVGILLVVWGHTMEPRSAYIYSFHMPLFFFVSGCLYRERPAGEFFPGKVRRLYLPYALFTVLSWLFYLAVLALEGKNEQFARQVPRILSLVTGTARNGGNDSIWFLPCLLVMNCLFWAVRRLPHPALRAAAIVACSVLGYGLGRLRFQLPFKADVALANMVFFAAGHLAGVWGLAGRAHGLRAWKTAAAALAAEGVHLAALAANLELAGIRKVSVTSNVLGDYFLYHLAALAAIATIGLLAVRVWGLVGLKHLGANSLIVLGTHKPLLYLVRKAAGPLTDGGSLPYQLSATAIVVLTVLPLVGPLNRHLPWVLGRGPRRPGQGGGREQMSGAGHSAGPQL